jgi:hypothetical protein
MTRPLITKFYACTVIYVILLPHDLLPAPAPSAPRLGCGPKTKPNASSDTTISTQRRPTQPHDERTTGIVTARRFSAAWWGRPCAAHADRRMDERGWESPRARWKCAPGRTSWRRSSRAYAVERLRAGPGTQGPTTILGASASSTWLIRTGWGGLYSRVGRWRECTRAWEQS